MWIEKTFYKEDMMIHYIITDNLCINCKHNPNNYCPIIGCDGLCKNSNKSVVQCFNFKDTK